MSQQHVNAQGADGGTATQQPAEELNTIGGETVDELLELGAATDDAETISLDDTFHILQNERRRQVLQYLQGVEGMVMMSDIAEAIAAWENDTTVENLHSNQRQRVYIALYQSHLPKLDNLGVIKYNQSRGYVEPTPLLDQVSAYLDQVDDAAEDGLEPDSKELLASFVPATLASGLLITAAGTGLGLAVISGLWLAVIVMGLYIASAAFIAIT